MSSELFLPVKYLVLPLAVAAMMYVLVHFQLLLLNKLVHFELSHRKRTRINIITFFSTFTAVILLVLVNDY